ncbi:hypothetical protein BDF14DRAFT_1437129 [Spinellus fusiger]|nr:hypothetical protein BDF14DRAFT_1437129 [Spinellus fusiger]
MIRITDENAEEPSDTLLPKSLYMMNLQSNNTLNEADNPLIPEIPLGKAMHILLNVKEQVFQQAVKIIKSKKEHEEKEITSVMTDSPVVNAMISLDNHIMRSTQNSREDLHEHLEPLKYIYDSLKLKIIKRGDSLSEIHSNHAMQLAKFLLVDSHYTSDFCAILSQELQSEDKRYQLAVVLLLESMTQEWPSLDTNTKELHTNIVEQIYMLVDLCESLANISIHYGDEPTVLSCKACDLVITCSKYTAAAITHRIITPEMTETKSPKIILIESTLTSDKKRTDMLRYSWKYCRRLMGTIESVSAVL